MAEAQAEAQWKHTDTLACVVHNYAGFGKRQPARAGHYDPTHLRHAPGIAIDSEARFEQVTQFFVGDDAPHYVRDPRTGRETLVS